MIRIAVFVVVVAVALFTLDRVLLAMERRGWIYWRKRKASPGTRAAAGLEIQQLLEPERRHVIEALRDAGEREDEDQQGDDVGRRGE